MPSTDLEVGDTSRFRSIKQAISYCGLCSAEKSSADKAMRTPTPSRGTSTSSKCWSKRPDWRRDTVTNWPWSTKGNGSAGMAIGHARGGKEDGGDDAGCRETEHGFRAFGRVPANSGSIKNLPKKEKTSGSFDAQTARSRI